MVESDESTVRIVLRRIVAPIALGLAIGGLAQWLIPWQVYVPVVVIGGTWFVVSNLRWVKRQQREMEEGRRKLEAFLAHYDRRKPS